MEKEQNEDGEVLSAGLSFLHPNNHCHIMQSCRNALWNQQNGSH